MSDCACIVVLVGLPACGKTFLAGKLSNYLASIDCSVKTFSFDDFVSLEEQAKIACLQSSETTRKYRQLIRDQVQTFISSPSVKSSMCLAIIDDNNYYRSMRYEYYQLAGKLGSGYLQVFLKCSLSDAIVSNSHRHETNRVPEDVIIQMDAKFEMPSELWGNCVTVEQQTNLDSLWNHILEACKNPVTTLQKLEEKKAVIELSRLNNDKSILHNVDKILRKKIGELIRVGVNPRVLAEQLNSARLILIDDIKKGVVVIPAFMADGTINMSELQDRVISIFLERCSS